jgi:hypothetical protein
LDKAQSRDSVQVFAKLTTMVDGRAEDLAPRG